ncbi:MAG: radical SAM protein [bacterium]
MQSKSQDLFLIKLPDNGQIDRFSADAKRTIIGECLGLAYIASAAHADGLRMQYVDASLEGIMHAELAERVAAANPAVVGMLLRHPFIASARRMARELKARVPKVHITVGGQYAAINASLLLAEMPELDSVCLGDGERGTVELVRHVAGSASFPSWMFRDRVHRTVRGAVRLEDHQLEALPRPDRKYLALSHQRGFETVGLSTSRGCLHDCSFCVPRVFSARARRGRWCARSAGDVVDEMAFHYAHGERTFTFSDENFLANRLARDRAYEMARLIADRKMEDLRIMFDCRADAVDVDLFRVLCQVGLRRVFVGFESSQETALSLYGKRLSPESQRQCIEICHALHIDIVPGFIFFNPYSTPAQIESDLEFYGLHFTAFDWDDYTTRLALVPNTPVAAQVIRDGLAGDMENGLITWRFRNSAVKDVYERFYDVTRDFRTTYHAEKWDPERVREMKKVIERRLLGELRRVQVLVPA